MNLLFLMDPLSTVKMEKDTSFAIMFCAWKRGHKIFYLPDGGVVLENNQANFYATPVTPQRVAEQPFIESPAIKLKENEVNAIFIRTDPPFDEKYLMHTWLLERLPSSIAIINNPSGIRAVNEKIWASQFTSIIPKTLIARRKDDISSFLEEEKDVVVKPTDGYGGSSIFRVTKGDLNTNVILETVTQNWSKDIILQKYIRAASDGDKRILLLDGEILGAVLRVHPQDDYRNNFFSGGKPAACEITQRDKEIIEVLKPELKRLGLYFVGIDIIGDYLIEVNVTSPTCLQEMNKLYNIELENKVIDFTEKLIENCKKS